MGGPDFLDTVVGRSTNHPGVLGFSKNSWGVHGETHTNLAAGVQGANENGPGVEGTTHGASQPGVRGESTGGGPGVLGECIGGTGVRGISTATAFISEPGVAGVSDDGSGVAGRSKTWFGVLGLSTNGNGVIGMCGSADGAAVIGRSIPEQRCGRAGLFNGPVDVFGNFTVSNGEKRFKIDHPLDPGNRYLLHSAVESSERKNVYDGVAQLDEDGTASVELPEWLEALNGDFRYQLTAVGGAAPDLHVAEEISENRFKLAGGEGGMKVCWQVTGTRKDPWAAANPFEVEQEKPQEERGRYLQPDLYDAPEEQRVVIGPDEEKLRQMMRQEEPSQPPQVPEMPQQPPQPPAMAPGAPPMPPGFDLVRLQQQLDELRGQIEELRRGRMEDEIDELRRQVKKLRRRRKR